MFLFNNIFFLFNSWEKNELKNWLKEKKLEEYQEHIYNHTRKAIIIVPPAPDMHNILFSGLLYKYRRWVFISVVYSCSLSDTKPLTLFVFVSMNM